MCCDPSLPRVSSSPPPSQDTRNTFLSNPTSKMCVRYACVKTPLPLPQSSPSCLSPHDISSHLTSPPNSPTYSSHLPYTYSSGSLLPQLPPYDSPAQDEAAAAAAAAVRILVPAPDPQKQQEHQERKRSLPPPPPHSEARFPHWVWWWRCWQKQVVCSPPS